MNESLVNYLNYIPTEAPPGAGTGNSSVSGSNLQNMIQALQGNSMKPPQQQQQQGGWLDQFNKNFGAQQGDNAMEGTNSGNAFAPGGNLSPFDSYINNSGDLMSGGQVIAG